jgi:chromate transporter
VSKRLTLYFYPVRVRRLVFLRDVFILACTAFGGPQVHVGMFIKRLVKEKNYLTEDEFMEIMTLCNVLPGPGSTQTITAIAYKIGGPLLALIALLIWALPASILITAVVLSFTFYSHIDLSFIKFLSPMAIGFVMAGGYTMGKAVIQDTLTVSLFIGATFLGMVFTSPWVYPLIIVGGAIIANLVIKEYNFAPVPGLRIKWHYIIAFFGILIGAAILGKITHNRLALLFENIYRFGSLVFGGGNVLVPLMYEQFVAFKHYMTADEFAMGYGLVQALPGPIFTLGTFAAGMSMKEYGWMMQLIGCGVGAVSIFLPGTLLIFFFFPIWQQVKKYPIFKKSVKGSNAASVGLILSAAIILAKPLLNQNGMQLENAMVMTSTFIIVSFTRLPSPFVVLGALLLGLLYR